MTYPNTVISMPSQLFTMRSSFKAVANGSVYIGEVDTDPTIPTNQIQVYIEQENGTLVPVAQPIKINSAGLLTASGQVQKFVLTNTEYSMTVQNSYDVDEFYFPRVYDQGISAALEVEERLLGPGAKIYRGSNGQYVQNGNVVPSETPPYTHLAVPINGKVEIVAMSPASSGLVSSLTETAATIGGVAVEFTQHKIIEYFNTDSISAVENMLADFAANPLSKSVGSIISTGLTTWEYKDSTGPITIDNFRAFNVLCVLDCGAKGDGVTDDYFAITKAKLIAKQKGLTLFFPELLFYVSQSASLGDVRVYAERAAYTDPVFALRPDGTNFVSNTTSPNWEYFYNSTQQGRDTTWRTHLESAQPGAAIISDVASPIITLNNGEHFNIEGLGVIGNHRLVGQHGIAHPTATDYTGNAHKFKDVRVTGCGEDGIHLAKGWELSHAESLVLFANNGYGLFTGVVDDGGVILDSATEYLTLKNIDASYNRKDGIFFTQYRKHLLVDGVKGSNNGQYNSASENGKIDPLLGYDRNVPTREDMAAVIRVNDVTLDSVGATGTCQNLHFKNMSGELTAKAIHIRARHGAGVLRNVTFGNLSFIRLPELAALAQNDPANGCVIYMDVKYLADVDMGTVYPQSLYQLDVENVDSTENNIRALGWTPVTAKEFSFLHWKYEGTLGALAFAAAQPIVRQDFTAPAVDTVQTSDIIKNIHTYYPALNVLSPVSKWRIYGQHQSNNARYYGTYEIEVFRNNLGEWQGISELKSEHPTGNSFTSAPTLNTDGTLNLPTRAFSMVRIVLVEGQTWIGGLTV